MNGSKTCMALYVSLLNLEFLFVCFVFPESIYHTVHVPTFSGAGSTLNVLRRNIANPAPDQI